MLQLQASDQHPAQSASWGWARTLAGVTHKFFAICGKQKWQLF
jgi:hypothetical protein